MKQTCNALFVLLGAWYLAFQITAIFQCTPVKFFWERSLPGGHCVDSVNFYIALATTNTFTDLVILFLPMPLVWRLQISRSKKVSISAVFLLGGFVCAIALYRITTLPLIDNNDITYSNTYAGIWTSIEGSVGVIVACLPSLMPIWHRLRGRSVGYAQYSRQSNPYATSSKGLRSTRSTGGGRFTDDEADRFDVFASGKWPVGSQSQERIVQTAVAYGEETYLPTDERNDTSHNAIGVVTEVHQQIELRDLGNVEQLK
ncbi:hypothetical protein N7478_000157 [Penicillium angulare]|uniref:uncharacterized protein n=1 Tax=Penicillium angulare TaxID=116970 RepID=UPI002541A227|nr:uncharacterized protein N7478_000157 [Penicillium angulare]KAJ5290906.1 hypothetical protein N7478_000157 [Penicillium angulare]